MRRSPRIPSTSSFSKRGNPAQKAQTLICNKPYGILSCFADPAGRPTLSSILSVPRVYPAGRLDLDSEGLLILTADGMLAHLLTDPAHKIPKTYLVQVERIPTQKELGILRRGVMVRGKRTRQANVNLLEKEPDLWSRTVPIRFRKTVPTAWLRMTIREGRNRLIRRMTASVGFPVLRLIRVAVGPIHLGNLQPGEWRFLNKKELKDLQELSCCRSA